MTDLSLFSFYFGLVRKWACDAANGGKSETVALIWSCFVCSNKCDGQVGINTWEEGGQLTKAMLKLELFPTG